MSRSGGGFSNDELISQRVNHLLFINRLTRRKAAEQLGISHSAFNTKMNGGSSWKADELIALTDRFLVSFDFLIGRQAIELAAPIDQNGTSPPAEAPESQ
jgi:hypothetical protein